MEEDSSIDKQFVALFILKNNWFYPKKYLSSPVYLEYQFQS